MQQLTESQKMAKVEALGGEICKLKELMVGAPDAARRQELEDELHLAVAQVNNILGTDGIMEGSKMKIIE